MQRKKGAGEGDGRGWGTSKTRRDPDESRAGNAPQHIMACQGAAVKGNIPPRGILGFPRRGAGRGGSPCAEKARATGLWTRGERTEKLLIYY